jgi:predicted RNase H-like HicB family nuclease
VSDAPRYPKHVFWSDEDEGFIATAPDLPGSSAVGDTEAEALAELDQAIEAWIEAARAVGNTVPVPSRPGSPNLPSGKVLVRMPKGLHQRAAQCAQREDVSLNQFIVVCVAEAVGERSRAIEPVRQVSSESLHQIHPAVGLWLQGNMSTASTASSGATVVHGAAGTIVGTVVGPVVLNAHEWHTTQALGYFDPITAEVPAHSKQDSIWNAVQAKTAMVKVGKAHVRG